VAEILLKSGADINKAGPDNLSAKDLIDIYDEQKWNKLLTLTSNESQNNFLESSSEVSEKSDFFKVLSKTYPVSNDDVVEDWIKKTKTTDFINTMLGVKYLNLFKAWNYLLGDFHLNPGSIDLLRQQETCIKPLSELRLQDAECPIDSNGATKCPPDKCEVMRSTFDLLQQVETNLCAKFGPISDVFFLPMGSSIEGTRVGLPDEADVSLHFKDLLDKFYLKEKNGMKIYVKNIEQGHALLQYCEKIGNDYLLNYDKLYARLIEDVNSAITETVNKGSYDENLKVTLNNEIDISNCDSCIQENESFVQKNGAFTHCDKHYPCVTMKKMGINLNFIWKCHDGSEMLITIDLIPTISLESVSPVEMQGMVVNTLKTQKPFGFKKHLQKFVERDLIFTDCYAENIEPRKCCAAIKRINYFDETAYIINSIQFIAIMNLTGFQKDIYVHLKFLKDICDSKLKSYYAKRLVTKEEFKSVCDEEAYRKEENDRKRQWMIYSTLKLMINSYNPELQEMFSSLHEHISSNQRLDFQNWDNYVWKIPLCDK